MINSPGSQKLDPPPDPDGIFPSASHGNASYFNSISTDPPNAPVIRYDKYQTVRWLYRRYGTDLWTGIWADLSYDCQVVLPYCGTEINKVFNKREMLMHLLLSFCK